VEEARLEPALVKLYDAIHDKDVERIDKSIASLIAVVRGKQLARCEYCNDQAPSVCWPCVDNLCNPEPPRAHVAGCECEQTKGGGWDLDSRCLPGLLHDAEVRLEVYEECGNHCDIRDGEVPPAIDRAISEARAEVERLKNGK
jgi:hypothetical protein